MSMRWLVTGGNRGIGLEFARQLAARGDEVIATARAPKEASALAALAASSNGRIEVVPCDVRDDNSVRAMATALGTIALDVLVNNAGVMGKMQSFEQLDEADMLATFNANAIGPLRVSRALLPHLLRGSAKKIVHISSGMGSIADNSSGGAYGYRMSKAALNMASRSLSVDLAGRGVISAVMNPGWVKTDMGGPSATTPVEESVRCMIMRIDQLALSDSGKFLDYRGGSFAF